MENTMQPGDYFLLPYAGEPKDNLVKALKPLAVGHGQWEIERPDGSTSVVLLSSCHPVSKARAHEILAAMNTRTTSSARTAYDKTLVGDVGSIEAAGADKAALDAFQAEVRILERLENDGQIEITHRHADSDAADCSQVDVVMFTRLV